MRMSESNMEHYRDEILNVLTKYDRFGKQRNSGAIKPCDILVCYECEFNGSCPKKRMLWLMEDYKPEITLTATEKGFVDCVETGYIARDFDGCLCWFNDMPGRSGETWDMHDSDRWSFLNTETFSFITWEDEEPWAVEELRKLKVKDE